jgi:hypothetical protein
MPLLVTVEAIRAGYRMQRTATLMDAVHRRWWEVISLAEGFEPKVTGE